MEPLTSNDAALSQSGNKDLFGRVKGLNRLFALTVGFSAAMAAIATAYFGLTASDVYVPELRVGQIMWFSAVAPSRGAPAGIGEIAAAEIDLLNRVMRLR